MGVRGQRLARPQRLGRQAGALGQGPEFRPHDVRVDLGHPSLRAVENVFEGLISGCSADVFADV